MKKYLLAATFSFTILSGCSHKVKPTVGYYQSQTSPNDDWERVFGNIMLSATTYSTGSNARVQYFSYAEFFSDTSDTPQKVYAGTLNVGNMVYTFNSQVQVYGHGSDHDLPIEDPTFKAIFGGSVTITVAGNPQYGLPGFTHSFYVPARKIVTLTPGGKVISKSSGVSVQWNPDPVDIDSVRIVLHYKNEISRLYDTTLTNYEYHETWFVPDNGNFTIPPNTISHLPVGGRMFLLVAKATETILPVSDMKYRITGLAVTNINLNIID